jgi:hypothetical protein
LNLQKKRHPRRGGGFESLAIGGLKFE